jgi:integral membrane protein
MRRALTAYRVMAWVVGVWLIVLVFVAMPLKYLADSPTMVEIVGPVHGFLYMAYLAVTLTLAYRARWSPVRTILVMLAGTVPFMSFVAERRVTRWLEPLAARS